MIPRYSREKLVDIWSDASKFKIWLEVETYVCEALAEKGDIPKSVLKKLLSIKNHKFDLDRIAAIESEVKHDVIAFLTYLSELIGEDARFVHKGLTSSDILDTTFNTQLKRSADILIEDLDKLLESLKKIAYKYKHTLCIGRSHGIHAEPITFGLKMASAYAEMERNKNRLVLARKEISTCAISGAVGTFANIDPDVERYTAEKMDLSVESISTQIIPRDRHSVFFATLGTVASSIERIATEIRHLQRTEILEVEEHFSKGQKGSSAMPHKRNPILTENLVGLARVVRMTVLPAMENVALWHERDISHSSVERFIGPDATITLDFAICRLVSVIDTLKVYPEKMKENLNKTNGLIFSQRVLLRITEKGMSREKAYSLIQKHAMESWDRGVNFMDLLKGDKDIKAVLSDNEIEEMFDIEYHMRYVDDIFKRVFKQ